MQLKIVRAKKIFMVAVYGFAVFFRVILKTLFAVGHRFSHLRALNTGPSNTPWTKLKTTVKRAATNETGYKMRSAGRQRLKIE